MYSYKGFPFGANPNQDCCNSHLNLENKQKKKKKGYYAVYFIAFILKLGVVIAESHAQHMRLFYYSLCLKP